VLKLFFLYSSGRAEVRLAISTVRSTRALAPARGWNDKADPVCCRLKSAPTWAPSMNGIRVQDGFCDSAIHDLCADRRACCAVLPGFPAEAPPTKQIRFVRLPHCAPSGFDQGGNAAAARPAGMSSAPSKAQIDARVRSGSRSPHSSETLRVGKGVELPLRTWPPAPFAGSQSHSFKRNSDAFSICAGQFARPIQRWHTRGPSTQTSRSWRARRNTIVFGPARRSTRRPFFLLDRQLALLRLMTAARSRAFR